MTLVNILINVVESILRTRFLEKSNALKLTHSQYFQVGVFTAKSCMTHMLSWINVPFFFLVLPLPNLSNMSLLLTYTN